MFCGSEGRRRGEEWRRCLHVPASTAARTSRQASRPPRWRRAHLDDRVGKPQQPQQDDQQADAREDEAGVGADAAHQHAGAQQQRRQHGQRQRGGQQADLRGHQRHQRRQADAAGVRGGGRGRGWAGAGARLARQLGEGWGLRLGHSRAARPLRAACTQSRPPAHASTPAAQGASFWSSGLFVLWSSGLFAMRGSAGGSPEVGHRDRQPNLLHVRAVPHPHDLAPQVLRRAATVCARGGQASRAGSVRGRLGCSAAQAQVRGAALRRCTRCSRALAPCARSKARKPPRASGSSFCAASSF